VTTAGETAYNKALLDFSDYNLIKCEKPELFESSNSKEYLRDSAFDDIKWADCIKRHNGLVDEILYKKQSLNN
jgi:hypothetical protein